MTKRIMILEDDAATAALVKFYLEEEGYGVMTANRGSGFVEEVAQNQPDLVTLDVLLPDTNGFEVLKALSEDQRTNSIPTVIITICEEDKQKGINLGAVGYVIKPFSEKDLKSAIAAAIAGDEE